MGFCFQVAVVITDGEMTRKDRQYENLPVLAADLKNKGVELYAIGIGKFSPLELEEIASKSENVFTSSSFENLKGTLSDRLTEELCDGEYRVLYPIFNSE